MSIRTVLLATTNSGKIRELKQMLAGKNVAVVGLEVLSGYTPPVESGHTFAANAQIKARAARRAFLAAADCHRLDVSSTAILADDSGLECDDLGGDPGVDSAYYAGPQAADAENNAKLVWELAQLPQATGSARYVCVLILVEPDGQERIFQAMCEGRIITTARGTNGFGYDPYFWVPDKNQTMAELAADEKNAYSHRGRALQKLLEFLGRS